MRPLTLCLTLTVALLGCAQAPVEEAGADVDPSPTADTSAGTVQRADDGLSTDDEPDATSAAAHASGDGEIDPCLLGRWVSGTFQLPPNPAPGLTFSTSGGSGIGLVFEPDGTATYTFEGMEPLSVTSNSGGRFSMTMHGEAVNRVIASDGVTNPLSSDLSGMSVSATVELPGGPVTVLERAPVGDLAQAPGGANPSTVLGSGRYVCDEDRLEIVGPEPSSTVTFTRQP